MCQAAIRILRATAGLGGIRVTGAAADVEVELVPGIRRAPDLLPPVFNGLKAPGGADVDRHDAANSHTVTSGPSGP
jgi:hypothetical protein